jgi:putative YpdA family bacillithiol system oxidoreductase
VETLVAFVIAAAVTFFFVRRYVKQLTAPQKGPARPAAAAAGGHAAAATTRPCPRCNKLIHEGSAFCSHCGAALAMWKVHSAAISKAGPGGGKEKVQPVINASLCVGCGSCVHVCPETGTLELVGGKAILAHPERCTGHAKCAEVCPTQAIVLSAGGVLQTLRVPHVKENYETNIPGLFIVGELGGMGLIKSAINEGKLVIDHLKSRLEESKAPAAVETAGANGAFDVAIVGAGPAGLSASLAAEQFGLKYVTLEQGEIASTIRQYPRQKFLMAEPIEMPLYGSLYIGDGTKEALLSVWETIIQNTGVKVNTNEGVQQIRRNGAGFYLQTAKGEYHAKYVVLAMGRRGTPRKLNVPGEGLGKVAYRLIEAESYSNSDILIVGGGDSAIEAALALSRAGSNRVTLSYRGDNFHRARERNRQQINEAAAHGKVTVLLNSNVSEILREKVVLQAGPGKKEFANQFVFILIGGESPDEFLQKTGVQIVEKSLAI